MSLSGVNTLTVTLLHIDWIVHPPAVLLYWRYSKKRDRLSGPTPPFLILLLISTKKSCWKLTSIVEALLGAGVFEESIISPAHPTYCARCRPVDSLRASPHRTTHTTIITIAIAVCWRPGTSSSSLDCPNSDCLLWWVCGYATLNYGRPHIGCLTTYYRYDMM